MKTNIYLQTTQVAAEKSAAEIVSLLAKAGAADVLNRFHEGRIVGLAFQIKRGDAKFRFMLPVRPEPVFARLQAQRKSSSNRRNAAIADRDQAERIAWRQVFRWLQAQLALIDLGMVTPTDVFAGYLVVNDDRTLGQLVEAGELPLALPAPAVEQ